MHARALRAQTCRPAWPVGWAALRRRAWRALAVCSVALGLGLGLAAQAQDLLPVPALTARVIDQTGTLQPAQAAALEAKLAAFEAEAGPQIVVLMVASTLPEDIAAYAQRVGDSWKIGRREVGDGLLIVVAKNDRRINIQTAKALEGAVPDLAARQIIDRAIKPAFRADDYAGGLDAALDQLMARIRGEALPAPAARSPGGSGLQLQELLIFFFIAVPVIGSVFTRALGRRFGAVVSAGAAGGIAGWLTSSLLLGLGAGLVALLLVGLFGIGAVSRALSQAGRGRHGGSVPWTTGGWSSGGGGGGWGGGGGFSSGGGGDFGGGGASGDW